MNSNHPPLAPSSMPRSPSTQTVDLSREACRALDAKDTLRATRDRFSIPPDTIYLDGNSLGALPAATQIRMAQCIADEWGKDLIRSWNSADWISYPQRLGNTLAGLIGASVGEVVVTDSTSVNLFKLLSAVLKSPTVVQSKRRVIVSERDNFPTDLYIAEGVSSMLGDGFTLKLVEANAVEASLTGDVAIALITQVDYRTGRLHDMVRLNQRAREAGCAIVWDLSHSAGAVPISLNESGASFAVGCGYKYLNGGPGAPAFCYVEKSLQAALSTPLSGWFAHARPFDFIPRFEAAPGIEKFLCGTPSILAMTALECGLATFKDVPMAEVRSKSLALTTLFMQLMEPLCSSYGLTCVTPTNEAMRGSHVSYSHPQGYAVMQALIERNVIGDFRQPNLLRFGFTPLYTRFSDCWDAVQALTEVMATGAYLEPTYQRRKSVT